jgi:3-oxoadipate enol-lactonase
MAGVRLSYELTNPAGQPVLVLANSLGTNSSMWDPQVPALSEKFGVLRYDHRGHGNSDVPPGPYAIDDLAADLIALLDTLGLERVSFCGLSLGGMVGLQVAASEPRRIERLAVCCTGARLRPASLWINRANQVRRHGTASVAETVSGRWFTPAFRERSPEQVRRAVAMLVATPAEGYAGCCEAIAGMDLRPILTRIVAPTLVIAGSDDRATPVAYSRAIAASIPKARLAVVSGAAHLANLEQPERITKLLVSHFVT